MAVSKKLRFEIFKRDLFTCQYCGATPPAVILEVDHILAKANKGLDSKDNLITACFDCNRGKSSISLDVCPETIAKKAEVLAEKQAQIRAFQAAQRKHLRLENKCIRMVEDEFKKHFEEYEFSSKFRESCRRFVQQIDVYALIGFMGQACDKMYNDNNRAIKYFCGICWRVIKEREQCRQE